MKRLLFLITVLIILSLPEAEGETRYVNSAREGRQLLLGEGERRSFSADNIQKIRFLAEGNKRNTAWRLGLVTLRGDTLLLRFAPRDVRDKWGEQTTVLVTEAPQDISREWSRKVSPGGEPNLWQLSLAPGECLLEPLGTDEQFAFDAPEDAVSEIFLQCDRGRLLWDDMALECRTDDWSEDAVTLAPVGSHPMEGEWHVLDRTFSEELLRLGGDYRLSCRLADDNSLVFFYLDGALTNAADWQQGDVKVRLRHRVGNIYTVTWYDAMHQPLSRDITAEYADGILTILFPYQNSSLRLIR